MSKQNRPMKKSKSDRSNPSQQKQIDDKVPMMFRAQIEYRCSLQKVDEQKYVEKWVNEWRDSLGIASPVNLRGKNRNIQRGRKRVIGSDRPNFGQNIVSKSYRLAWRIITNSGADPSIHHPTIGAQGLPFYTGSSMKGAFLRALQAIYKDDKETFQQKQAYYCGRPPKTNDGEDRDNGSPSSIGLRFHGGYPIGDEWAHRMIDLVHPQEGKQVTGETDNQDGLRFQITLQDCDMEFGFSSPVLGKNASEWQEIWQIWEKALEQGLGSRTSAGYGFFKNQNADNPLVTAHLEGVGLASKLQDEQLSNIGDDIEFRPNMFKAALRGHTLRLFAGMTDEINARQLTELLWGGLNNTSNESDRRPIVGLLRTEFEVQNCEVGYDENKRQEAFYQVEGSLKLFCTKPDYQHQAELQIIAKQLLQFAMIFGGFGKSWRRTDHSNFYLQYSENSDHSIGCYWEFIGESKKLNLTIKDKNLSPIADFINQSPRKSCYLGEDLRIKLLPVNLFLSWREAWFQAGNNNHSFWCAGLGKNSPREFRIR